MQKLFICIQIISRINWNFITKFKIYKHFFLYRWVFLIPKEKGYEKYQNYLLANITFLPSKFLIIKYKYFNLQKHNPSSNEIKNAPKTFDQVKYHKWYWIGPLNFNTLHTLKDTIQWLSIKIFHIFQSLFILFYFRKFH